MDKLKMQTANRADENFRKLAEMFPNAVTETIDENGEVVRAIDKDVLMQEINTKVVDGKEERYQFTWPDKKKSVLLANAPINKTLRPCREESVDFDNTENLYIEGDNLEVLKLLQETYLGKIKMIYIDPPYNTGSDFVYEDDFAQSTEEYLANSGHFDEDGNRLFKNMNTNGRFHTDWLNMIYPRLKIAKDLLMEDGIMLISIDYNENFNMRSIANEIFGNGNFVGEIYWESKTKSQNTLTSFNKLQPKAEMILVYIKNGKARFNLTIKGKKEYPYVDKKGEYREYPVEVMNANGIRGRESMIFPISDGISTILPPEGKQWQIGKEQIDEYYKDGDLFIRDNKAFIKMRPMYERQEETEPFWGFFTKEIGTTESAKKELSQLIKGHGFETVKPIELIKKLVYHTTKKNDYVLDFFSGSATTAHAVMQLNAEDGGRRKFIMVQIPEKIDENKEAFKAGYKNICEIGKERIRRAGKKIQQERIENMAVIKHEWDQTTYYVQHKEECGKLGCLPDEYYKKEFPEIDTGFRVLKLDSSNMKDVYYNPSQYEPSLFEKLEDNIKEDRTPEDLLFQVMLDLGVLLSSKIEETIIGGKKVFNVADGFLIACFDDNVTDETITAVAKQKPYYFVMRDSSMASDSVATNFEQIFATYSPDTVRKVL